VNGSAKPNTINSENAIKFKKKLYLCKTKKQQIKDNSMKSVTTPINISLPLIISLFEKHKIKDAYLFGSAITDRFDEKKSDVDFLVNFIDGIDPLEKGELLWNLRFSLEDNLKRPIDLITETSLKNPYFIEEVNETKMKIYG
jgi:predicted nucleotidyltransferase